MVTKPVSVVMLRPAVAADIPRLMEIRAIVRENRLVNLDRVTRADYEWFVDHGMCWVAEEQLGAVLGFAAGDPRDGSVWALFVDPSAEGQGLGRQLLERVCAELNGYGHTSLMLTTAAGTRAERFYRTGGWRQTGTTVNGELIFNKP